MVRRMGALLLSLLVALAIALPVYAEVEEQHAAEGEQAGVSEEVILSQSSASVWLDGEQVFFGEQPLYMVSGTTYAPAGTLLYVLGLQPGWDDSIQLVHGSRAGWFVGLQAGTGAATVNGKEEQLPLGAVFIGEDLYVPLRFVSEAAGYTVGWSAAERTITLTEVGLAEGEGFLWKVEREDAVVYLLGSIHVADGSLYPLRNEIIEAIIEADYLGVEIDLTMADEPEVHELVFALSQLEEGTLLSDVIEPELYGQLVAALEENGIPGDAFNTMKPWVVSTAIDSLSAARAGYDGSRGIDLFMTMQAVYGGIPIIELESYESQLLMLDTLSEELQALMLQQSLDNYAASSSQLAELVAMWADGDLDTLLQVIESVSDYEELNEAVLVKRNHAMTEQIIGYLTSGEPHTWLVTVGAAHMIGETGIVSLLERQGYKVERQ